MGSVSGRDDDGRRDRGRDGYACPFTVGFGICQLGGAAALALIAR
jgi:hypothetical protein